MMVMTYVYPMVFRYSHLWSFGFGSTLAIQQAWLLYKNTQSCLKATSTASEWLGSTLVIYSVYPIVFRYCLWMLLQYLWVFGGFLAIQWFLVSTWPYTTIHSERFKIERVMEYFWSLLVIYYVFPLRFRCPTSGYIYIHIHNHSLV